MSEETKARPNAPDDAEIARAVAFHRDGRLAEAEAAYRVILDAAPDHDGALHNLGVVLAQGGRPTEAVALFDRAIGAAGLCPCPCQPGRGA